MTVCTLRWMSAWVLVHVDTLAPNRVETDLVDICRPLLESGQSEPKLAHFLGYA